MVQELVDDGMTSAEDPAERSRLEVVDVDISVVGMIDGVPTKRFQR